MDVLRAFPWARPSLIGRRAWRRFSSTRSFHGLNGLRQGRKGWHESTNGRAGLSLLGVAAISIFGSLGASDGELQERSKLRMFAFGNNMYSQLGFTSRQSSVAAPAGVGDDLDIVLVASRGHMSACMDSNGHVYGFGRNIRGSLGQGEANLIDCAVPTRLHELDRLGVQQIAVGEFHMMALAADGTIYSTGRNWAGECGRGGDTLRMGKINSDLKFSKIACGSSFSAAVDKEGNLYTWGDGSEGALGHGNFCSFQTPELVMALQGKVADVSCGEDMLLVRTKDGDLYSCGNDQYGNLGQGSNQIRRRPALQKVRMPDDSKVAFISCGDYHWACITESGTLFLCGRNADGQLGNGTKNDSAIPVSVPLLHDKKVSLAKCGGGHSGAILEDGSVWLWGKGRSSQLGVGDTLGAQGANRTEPSQVGFFNDSFVVDLALGRDHTLCLSESR